MATKMNRRHPIETLALLEPVPYGGAEGGELAELVFYKPRGDVWEHLEEMGMTGANRTSSLHLVAALTGVPVEIIRTFCLEDTYLASLLSQQIVTRKIEAATARAKELGIELPQAEEAQETEASLADAVPTDLKETG